jgi:2-keto-4-pentenoate hydratase/2-oxohepta-3-ene-1,7-dioic acid hydratase in catechol pathway
MKLITYTQGAAPRPGLVVGDNIVGENLVLDLLAADPSLLPNWHGLLPRLDAVRAVHDRLRPAAEKAAAALAAGDEVGLPFVELRRCALTTPIILPSKIIAVGLNYKDHAAEQNKPLPERPLLFSKASTCLQAPGGPIELPDDLKQVDAEGEIAFVISKPGRAIGRERAREHIGGYMCFNDISDREAQYSDKQFFRGKSLDTGGPCGPWLVTPDELPDLALGLRIRCLWNDVVMQDSNTDQLIFPPDFLVSYISRHMTLLPGDIITTGTPGGVGVFRDPPVFLKPGDTVKVEIEGLGSLSNPVRRWQLPA